MAYLEGIPILVSVISAVTVCVSAFIPIQTLGGNLACSFSLEIAQSLLMYTMTRVGWVITLAHTIGPLFPLDNGATAEANKISSSCMIPVDIVWLLQMSSYYHNNLKGYNNTMGSNTVEILNAIRGCCLNSATEHTVYKKCRGLPGESVPLTLLSFWIPPRFLMFQRSLETHAFVHVESDVRPFLV